MLLKTSTSLCHAMPVGKIMSLRRLCATPQIAAKFTRDKPQMDHIYIENKAHFITQQRQH